MGTLTSWRGRARAAATGDPQHPVTKDVTWSDSAIFSCPCGALYPVVYWRWVDVGGRPDLAEQVLADGPYEGSCPVCGRTARAAGTWLRVDASAELATLVMSRARRGALLAELRGHLDALEQRRDVTRSWMLQPATEFVELPPLDQTGGSGRPRVVEPLTGVARSGELIVDLPPPKPRVRERGLRVEAEPSLYGIPELIGNDFRSTRADPPSTLGALIGRLELEGSHDVRISATVTSEQLSRWESAKLDVRPIHLRGRGYPLVGVRIVGFFMGQQGCIDAFIDAATGGAAEVFRELAREFRATLVLRHGSRETQRSVAHAGLEPNAALCLQSARGLLSRGEYATESFPRAIARLAEEAAAQRLQSAAVGLSEGAYRYIMGADEAVRALEHLDRVSRKEHLSRVLEVDGFPVAEYEGLRHRILAGALEYGLVAPRRFWKRILALGLARDLEDYAEKLASARAEHEGEEGDLEPESAREAWEGILELCARKSIPPPPQVRAALQLGSGEAGHPRGRPLGHDHIDDMRRRLRDPATRLKLASDLVQGRTLGSLDLVFEVLELFEVDEILALLPDLSELGPRGAPRLILKLDSPRREVRQSAAILLGLSTDERALEPLAEQLIEEQSSAWLDVARAIGSFGSVALPLLCNTLRLVSGSGREDEAEERVARALAEVALSEAPPGGADPAYQDVAGLLESPDPRVCSAARRALATLRDVSESGAILRGELPGGDPTGDARGFAQRAYEAIMVPEVEVEAEA